MDRWMEVWREYPELSEKDLLVSRCVVPSDAVDGTKSRVFLCSAMQRSMEVVWPSTLDTFEPPEPTPVSFSVPDPTFLTARFLVTS